MTVTFVNTTSLSVDLQYSGGGRSGSRAFPPGARFEEVFTRVMEGDFNLMVFADQAPTEPGRLGQRWGTSCRLGPAGYQSKRVTVRMGPDDAGGPSLRCDGWV